jgi:hypothetical protein
VVGGFLELRELMVASVGVVGEMWAKIFGKAFGDAVEGRPYRLLP